MNKIFKEIGYRMYRFLMYPALYCKFKKVGIHSIIYSPNLIKGAGYIEIGDYVRIYKGLRIETVNQEENLNRKKIFIGNHVAIGQYAHIISKAKVTIDNYALLADRVFITDCEHNYCDVEKPVMYQGTRVIKEITIGEGSWIGENVCILGANVGKQTVIGANSVVTKDIPDYCIAVGTPAKVIKKYDKENREWKVVQENERKESTDE